MEAMKIIDRYMLRQFVQTFLICYFSLTGLFIVFDAFANLDEFLRCAENEGGLLVLLWSHYSYQSIAFFDRSSALLVLVAAMFVVTWIQRHNEMTALQAAGVSRVRVIRPVIIAAAVITLLAAVNRELLLPHFREQLAQRPQDLVGDVAQDLKPRYDNKTDILLRGSSTFGDKQRIARPNFLLPPALDQYGSQLIAEDAFYKPPEGDRPAGYLLDKVEKPKGLSSSSSLSLAGRPVLITPKDADWLEKDQCFVASDLTFEQLTGGQAWRNYSSTFQLIEGLKNESLDFGANVRVAVHSRFTQPLLDMTLLFLGVPLVLRREMRNVFIAIGLCAAVVSGFMLVVIAFQHLGSILAISPSLAAWGPLMLFAPAAVGMSHGMWE